MDRYLRGLVVPHKLRRKRELTEVVLEVEEQVLRVEEWWWHEMIVEGKAVVRRNLGVTGPDVMQSTDR